MSNITCAKLATYFFVIHGIVQAFLGDKVLFVGGMVIASVFCAAGLVIEEVNK